MKEGCVCDDGYKGNKGGPCTGKYMLYISNLFGKKYAMTFIE